MTSADTAHLQDALGPLKDHPESSAVLLDVDGTLAPIVAHVDDAHVPEATRRPLIEIAKRYRVVACVSGRRAADARRIVSLGSIAYLGSHGSEVLRPGSIAPDINEEIDSWARQVQAFARDAYSEELQKQRIRFEDKGSIVAFHWRGVPTEESAHAELEQVSTAAEAAGFSTHWGRKVLEIRPPVQIDKGVGVSRLLREFSLTSAVYVGDDTTDLDAFRALGELRADGTLRHIVRVGVTSDEGPSALADRADFMVPGPGGVRALLQSLLD